VKQAGSLVLAHNVYHPNTGQLIGLKNQDFSLRFARYIRGYYFDGRGGPNSSRTNNPVCIEQDQSLEVERY
jgi:hypothetical protein